MIPDLAALTLATALAFAGPQDPPPSDPDAAPATSLSDVIVDGRTLEARVEAFVEEVAAPPRRRGLARWDDPVCIGVANIRPDIARAMIDHVSRTALDLGLRVEEPDCSPNVLVIFSDDGRALAAGLVERDRDAFHLGVGGMDRGKSRLETFTTGDQPVRWWQVSLPVAGPHRVRAIRLPGDFENRCVAGEGLLNRGRFVSDNLNKVIIVIDAGEVAHVTLPQLSDYVALVALAQVDIEGETGGYPTILNLFENPAGTPGLSAWDGAYLRTLYEAPSERLNPDGHARIMARALGREEAAAPGEAGSAD